MDSGVDNQQLIEEFRQRQKIRLARNLEALREATEDALEIERKVTEPDGPSSSSQHSRLRGWGARLGKSFRKQYRWPRWLTWKRSQVAVDNRQDHPVPETLIEVSYRVVRDDEAKPEVGNEQ